MQWFLVPTFHSLSKEHLAQWPPFVYKIRRKTPGVLLGTLGGGVRHASWNPYPISDQNLWFSLPYFRPEALEPGAWPGRVTNCYSTYTVVGVKIKREMVLSRNDEEVANSSKKHTQFKTRVHKPYPISDQKGRNWYPIFKPTWLKYHTLLRRTYLYSLYEGVPPLGEKRVADYESSL